MVPQMNEGHADDKATKEQGGACGVGGVSGNGWICCRAEHARRWRRPRTILNSSRKRGALRTSSIRSRVPGRICSARQSGLVRSACLDGVEGTEWHTKTCVS